MEQTELHQRLKKLDADKLIDVVKNYRQYGYDETIRSYALSLLEAQGISQADLLLTGNLENTEYNLTDGILTSFEKNSRLAFLFYILLLILKGIAIWFRPETNSSNLVLLVGLILTVVLYFFFLIKSFLNQSDFYKLTGEEFGSYGGLLYLILGMPFYIIMYFIFRNQMKERLKMIR